MKNCSVAPVYNADSVNFMRQLHIPVLMMKYHAQYLHISLVATQMITRKCLFKIDLYS